MTSANVLFFNPSDCLNCTQGYTTWNRVIDEAIRDGHNVISCLGVEAEIVPLAEKIALHKPTLLLYFNHGGPAVAAGNTVTAGPPAFYEPVLWIEGYIWPYGAHPSPMPGYPAYGDGQPWDGNTQILNNMIVYLDVCSSAQMLGPEIINNGARAYLGNNDLWYWIQYGGTQNVFYPDGYDDPLAYYFWWSSQNVARALLKQKTVLEAFNTGINSYNACIDFWTNHPPLPEWAADEITYLTWDRDVFVHLGDSSAKIHVCEDVTTQTECLDCGGIWINGQCKPMVPSSASASVAVTLFNTGMATILNYTAPAEIEPNTPFEITYTVKNTGGQDYIYGQIYENEQLNASTQWQQLVPQNGTVTKTVPYPNGIPGPTIIEIEVGHIATENQLKDDAETFTLNVTGDFFGNMMPYQDYFMNFSMRLIGNAHAPTYSGLAQEIHAYLKTSSPHNARAALYKLTGTSGVLTLHAATEEIAVTSEIPTWYTFPFTNPPVITAGTTYVLVLFSNAAISCGVLTTYGADYYTTDQGHNQTYPIFPQTDTFYRQGMYLTDLYCRYIKT